MVGARNLFALRGIARYDRNQLAVLRILESRKQGILRNVPDPDNCIADFLHGISLKTSRTFFRSATNSRYWMWRCSSSGARKIEAGCTVAVTSRAQGCCTNFPRSLVKR